MRWYSVLAMAVCLPALAGCEPKKAVGEPCTHDRECDNGFCLDLSVVDDGCSARICTQGCSRTGDCPPVATEPDCESFGGRSFCLYGEWENRYCRRGLPGHGE